jgi:hypothetical protein
MGYKFKKVNGRRILCESTTLKSLKIAFLRKYLQFCNSPNPPTFIYLDGAMYVTGVFLNLAWK